MNPVHLAVTVEGVGFEALLANLRDRLTANSIFIDTDRPIALRTPVSIEVSYLTGETALRGGGSVADIRALGVVVQVEWEAASRPLVDRILLTSDSGDFTDQDEEPVSWADHLFDERSAFPAPTFEPDMVEDEPLQFDAAPSWLQPDDGSFDFNVDVSVDVDIDIADEGGDETPWPELTPIGPAGLPVFEVPPAEEGHSLAQDFQKLIDETIPAEADADAIVHQRNRAPSTPPAPPPQAPPVPVDDLKLETPPSLPRVERLERVVRDLGPKGDVVIGIDLGTTYSCAAIVENGEARVLATRRGKPTLPSVVYYDPSGRTLTGEAAIKLGDTDALRAIVGSKRLMGRPYHSPIVQEVRDHFAYEIVQGPDGEAAISVDGRVIALEDVAADILRELRESAGPQINGRVNRAVITCPAYFNDRQREAVRVAGELAGFHVERVLNEPTAAALHYGYGKAFDGRKLLVYDLGGGTFDVSLLEVTGTVYEVLATGGDSFLGGIDFDACIAEMLSEAFLETEDIDPRTDPLAVAKLLHYAEKAKRELSTNVGTTVQVDHLVVKPYAGRSLTVELSQARVERSFEPFIDRTLRVVEEVCQRAGVTLDQVHDILLVGGQTRTPMVRRKVAELFGRQPISSVHPDYAVALGAAQYAASIEAIDNIVLIDALPMSIGVGLPGGRFKKIIDRDTRLPVKRKYTLHTTRDNQPSFEILVFQGEDDWVQHNEPLGMLYVPNLPRAPRGELSVDIELEVDEENILKMTARESRTGKVVEAKFGTKDTPEELRGKLGLPPHLTHAELAKMKEEANRPKSVWRWLTGLFARDKR